MRFRFTVSLWARTVEGIGGVAVGLAPTAREVAVKAGRIWRKGATQTAELTDRLREKELFRRLVAVANALSFAGSVSAKAGPPSMAAAITMAISFLFTTVLLRLGPLCPVYSTINLPRSIPIWQANSNSPAS